MSLPLHAGSMTYMAESDAQDQMLRDRLTAIRWQQEAGTITEREAADARVAAFEHHLAASRAVRAEHFLGAERG
jgi:hypothetical protein